MISVGSAESFPLIFVNVCSLAESNQRSNDES
jgi:hypothetical protein